MAIDVDLDGKRKPRLQLDVDQPELAVEEAAVEVQTFEPRRLDERVRLFPEERENRFNGVERTDSTGSGRVKEFDYLT